MQKIFKIIFIIAIAITTFSCSKNNPVSPIIYPDITKIDFPALFVVNGESSNIYVIKLSDNSIAGKIPLTGAKYPHHITLSRDKNNLAVACVNVDLSGGHNHSVVDTNGYNIFILNPANGNVSKTISTVLMPHSVAFSPIADELWVSQPEDGESNLNVYSTTNGSFSVKSLVSCGGDVRDICFSYTGKYLYTADAGTNNLTVLSGQLRSKVTDIPLALIPTAISKGTDNKMYVSSDVDNSITIIDIATNTIESKLQLSFKPSYTALNSTTGHLWINDPVGGNVYVYEKLSGVWTQKVKISTGLGSHAIVFSSANICYISNELANSITIIDAVKLEKINTILVGGKPNGLVIKE